jgi:hypothetical protein
MKWKGDDFTIQWLFADDMAYAPISDELKEEFMALYSSDFTITSCGCIELFLRMVVEQTDKDIKLRLDMFVWELLYDSKKFRPKYRKSKKLPMQLGVILTANDYPSVLTSRLRFRST